MDKYNEECKCDHEHDDCECEHGEHEYEEVDVIYLTLDDDTELECYIMGTFEVEVNKYIALVPKEQERVLLYRYKEENEEIKLENIEDDEEFETVSQAYYELFVNEE